MKNIVGILREGVDKRGEKRTAITPKNAKHIIDWGYRLLVEPATDPYTGSIKRAFDDIQYKKTGAEIVNKLTEAKVIFGLKEINTDKILENKTYLFFSHTHKGQTKNRKMLKRLAEKKSTLIDYELIADNEGKRMITAFTYIAGNAGMIDTLWALGNKLRLKGFENPFENIKQSVNVGTLAQIKNILSETGDKIKIDGTPSALPPFIFCILGRGKTSTGAKQILDMLPCENITLNELPEIYQKASRKKIYKLVLKVYDMFKLKEKFKEEFTGNEDFEKVAHYLKNPEMCTSNMENILPYITVLTNCIFWSDKYPRLITNKMMGNIYAKSKTLLAIGDITCDPNGSIEFSKETWIDNPVYNYNPKDESFKDGFLPEGITVMAVTNLPCEFSADASEIFSDQLLPFLKEIISADYESEFLETTLPPQVKNAVIMWNGKFTEKYKYMEKYIT